MRKITALICLIFLTSAFSFSSEGAVFLYSGLSPEKWGRSETRDETMSIDFFRFQEAMSLPGPEEGYLTAVLMDGNLADVIYGKLDAGQSVSDGQTTLSSVDYNGKQAYRLKQRDWGLDVIFTLEKTPAIIMEEIKKFYDKDSYNKNLVLQEYQDNQVIRVFRGNDIIDGDGTFSYGEAMVCATLIGKTFQPFYGIHDGMGFLANIGYLLEEARPALSIEPLLDDEMEYNEYRDFVFRAKSMEGSLPENIYILARTLCRLKEGSDEYASPDEFLKRSWGGSRDFSLLFYKVLREFNYEVKLLRINPGSDLPNEYMIVYRSPGGRMWGFMGAEYWTGERFGNWTRIPALYKGRSIQFQELEGGAILSESRWFYPGASRWQESYY
ncbi:MAG: hypothetical protein JEY99_10955 [Spirochaetales bacterium]|nr:hypothetical protein [Spirochaetales bacterium]